MTTELENNPEKCEDMRSQRKEGVSYLRLKEKFGLETMYEALLHNRGFCSCHEDVEASVEPVTDDSPWHDRDLMLELYAEHYMSFIEMGERLGCHNETARSWIADEDKHDIIHELLGHRKVQHTSSPTARKCQLASVDWKSHIEKKQKKLREKNSTDSVSTPASSWSSI